jgi:hypothetical protein
MRTALVLIALSAAFVTGCTTTMGTARTRAANDFGCAEDRIQVTDIGGTSYRASGCGQSATYDCVQSTAKGFGFGGPQVACVPEGAGASPGGAARQ